MKKLSLMVVAIATVVTALLTSSLLAQPQSAARFEYLRVTPYQTVTQGRWNGYPSVTYKWAGYQACLANNNEWLCRDFESKDKDDTNAALRATLVTLGNEGWELVSAVDERHERNSEFGGLTYLFKRQRQ